MVQINFAQKEIQCKIVYYGPGMSGKTTNLELVHGKVPDEHRGELTSIATTGERTLYFDYMPLDLGQIAGIRTKFQLYTVPGQIYYKSTRRLVLQGVDGIVFVADSSRAKMRENKESMADLEENLQEMGKSVTDVPILVQYNKRDLPDAMTIEDLESELNTHGFPYTEAVATNGEGVFPTLKKLASLVLEAVNKGGLAGARGRSAAKPKPVQHTAPPTPAPASHGKSQGKSQGKGGGKPSRITRPVGGAQAPEGGQGQPVRPAAQAAPVAAMPSIAPPQQQSAVATATAPRARTSARSNPVAVREPHAIQDRVVHVAGLRRRGPGNLSVLLALGAVIAGATWFLLTFM